MSHAHSFWTLPSLPSHDQVKVLVVFWKPCMQLRNQGVLRCPVSPSPCDWRQPYSEQPGEPLTKQRDLIAEAPVPSPSAGPGRHTLAFRTDQGIMILLFRVGI